MGVRDMDQFLERWDMDVPGVRRRMILAPVPGILRERWYALWLLTQGWTAQATAEATGTGPATPLDGGRRPSERAGLRP